MENLTQPTEGEKKFTQAEVDAIIGKRLAEERAKFPTAEEMSKYNAYKAAQATDAEKMTALATERDTARNDLAAEKAKVAQLQHEALLAKLGAPTDDIEYVDFKVRQMVTAEKNYETAAKEFISGWKAPVHADMGGNLDGGASPQSVNSTMNAIIRGARKR